jgi:hypothetical protein
MDQRKVRRVARMMLNDDPAAFVAICTLTEAEARAVLEMIGGVR